MAAIDSSENCIEISDSDNENYDHIGKDDSYTVLKKLPEVIQVENAPNIAQLDCLQTNESEGRSDQSEQSEAEEDTDVNIIDDDDDLSWTVDSVLNQYEPLSSANKSSLLTGTTVKLKEYLSSVDREDSTRPRFIYPFDRPRYKWQTQPEVEPLEQKQTEIEPLRQRQPKIKRLEQRWTEVEPLEEEDDLEDARRNTHNTLERKRRNDMSTDFADLHRAVYPEAVVNKQTRCKIRVLRAANKAIKDLKCQNEALIEQLIDAKRCNKEIKRQLRTLDYTGVIENVKFLTKNIADLESRRATNTVSDKCITSTLMSAKGLNNKLLVVADQPSNKRLQLCTPGYKSARCHRSNSGDSTDSSPKTVYVHSLLSKLKSSDAPKTRPGNSLDPCSPEKKSARFDHSYDSPVTSGVPTSGVPQTMYSHSPSDSNTSAGSSPEDDGSEVSNEASAPAGSEQPASSTIVINILETSEIVSATNSVLGQKSQKVEASSELLEESTTKPPSLLGKMFQDVETSILRQTLEAASTKIVTTTTKTVPNKATNTVSKTTPSVAKTTPSVVTGDTKSEPVVLSCAVQNGMVLTRCKQCDERIAFSNKVAGLVVCPKCSCVVIQYKPSQLKTATPVTGGQNSLAIGRRTRRTKKRPVIDEIIDLDSDGDDEESAAPLGVKSAGSSPQVAAGSSPQGAAGSSPQGAAESSPQRAAPSRVTPGDVLDVLKDGVRGYVDNFDGDEVIVVLK